MAYFVPRRQGTWKRVPCRVITSFSDPNLGKHNEEVWNCSTDTETSWLVIDPRLN